MAGARRIVLTGGPGSGKTTLVERLAAEGWRVSGEVGRRIIRDEVAAGGDALPWSDRAAFADRMLDAEIEAHEAAAGSADAVFFDRGVPDVLGYLRLCGLAAPERARDAARSLRYSDPVFLAPFWPEIFANDAERKQSTEEARRTAETMRATYSGLGYEVVDLPFASVEERLGFILDRAGLRRPH